jgi:CBS domain-containing protein
LRTFFNEGFGGFCTTTSPASKSSKNNIFPSQTIMSLSQMNTKQLWLAYRKSLSFVASNRTVHHAWESSPSQLTKFCISENDSVREALKRFVSEGVESLVATNNLGTSNICFRKVYSSFQMYAYLVVLLFNQGRVAGIVSERDVMQKVALLDRDPENLLVKDIFTPPPHLIVVKSQTSLDDCISRLNANDVYILPILDDAADLVGIVSARDCLRVMLQGQQESNE